MSLHQLMTAGKESGQGFLPFKEVFVDAFLNEAHRLIVRAHSQLAKEKLGKEEETVITDRLAKAMQDVIDHDEQGWEGRYYVHENFPVRNTLNEQGEAQEGKKRPLIDIAVIALRQKAKLHFFIEAKRLYRPDSIAEYLGENGLGAFCDGSYASHEKLAGMLGYVQTESVASWRAKICKKLGPAWTPCEMNQGLEPSGISEHPRKGRENIRIYHSFLQCF